MRSSRTLRQRQCSVRLKALGCRCPLIRLFCTSGDKGVEFRVWGGETLASGPTPPRGGINLNQVVVRDVPRQAPRDTVLNPRDTVFKTVSRGGTDTCTSTTSSSHSIIKVTRTNPARSGGGTATTVVATIDAKAEIIVLTPVARVRAALTYARPVKAPPVLTAGASYVHTSARIEVVAMIIVGGDTLRNGRHRNYDHTSTIRLGSNIHAPPMGERQYMIHEVHNQHRDNGRSTRTFCRNSRSRTRS